MKSFIVKALKFSGFTLLAYILLIIIWGSFAPFRFKKNLNYNLGGYGNMFTRMQEIKQVTTPDILVLGSSHAYRGFDPRVFKDSNLDLFNAGSSSQSPIHSELLLKRYLKSLKPKLVVIEVYPGTFCSDGVEASLDFISNDKNDLLSFKLILSQNHLKLYNTYVYALFRDLTGQNNNFKEPLDKEEDGTYISGGFVTSDLRYYEYRQHEPREWKFNPNQFRAFERIVKIAAEKQVEILFIQAPITRALFAAYTNNRQFDELMQNYGTYYNFNHLINLDDSLHFYDGHHLNQNGVELFNAKVIEVLKRDGHLTN
jgi:hypothetical protein